MASPPPDAELAAPTISDSSPRSFDSTAVNAEASLAPEAEVESSTSPNTSFNPSDGSNNGLTAIKDSTRRPAPETGAPNPALKRKKRAEYSVETRALCVRRHQIEGASYAMISKELAIPQDTVRAIIRKAKRTGSVVSAPRSGRPRKTSGIVDKVILEAVRSNKQCSAKTIQEELLRVYGVKLSSETVRRRVLEHTKQRIQSISGGTTSEVTSLSTEVHNTSATSDVVRKAPDRSPNDSTHVSLLDPVSYQQSLHVEGQHTSNAGQEIGSLVSTSSSSSTEAAPAAFPPPGNDDVAVVEPVVVPPEQPAILAQQEEEPVTQKRHKRAEYSIETREQCVALHAQGQGYRRIGKALNMPHTTVRAIVEKAQRTGSVLPAKRSGRPRITDAIVDKVILQAVKTNEKSSARMIKEQLLAAYGVRVSCETIRRRVKDHSRLCMAAAATTATSEMLSNAADTALDQQQTSTDQELLEVTSSPPMPDANIMTFDENGVHL